MEKSVILYENKSLNISVRMIENPDGSVSMNAEDAAFGFGWTQSKDGKTYPRWDTVNQHCRSFGFSQQVGKDTYIPEAVFYLLGMKANNKTALDFQKWIALDVLPSIRRTGSYAVKNAVEQRRMTNAQARLTAASAKRTDAEARLLREQNRGKKLDNDRFTLELKSVKLYSAAKGADKAVVAEVMRRNGISVPEEAVKPAAPEPDIDFQAALEILRRVGESAGTHKRHRNAEYLCIPAPEARDALNGQGFDPRAVFDFARSAGMLRTGKKGYSFTACIDGQPVNCLWLASAFVNANA